MADLWCVVKFDGIYTALESVAVLRIYTNDNRTCVNSYMDEGVMEKVIKYRFSDEDVKTFKKFLIDKDMSLRAFAKEIGTTAAYLSFLMNNKRLFTQKMMDRINKFCGGIFKDGEI